VKIEDAMNGCVAFQLILTAVKIRLHEFLMSGPKKLDSIVDATGIPADRLEVLLNGLILCDVLDHTSAELYSLTPMAREFFEQRGKDVETPVVLGDYIYQAMGVFHNYLQTGQLPFVHIHGKELWQSLDSPLAKAMRGESLLKSRYGPSVDVSELPALRGVKHIVDIGGNSGRFLASILELHPNAQGVVFDFPGFEAAAKQTISDERVVAGRIRFQAGDPRVQIPGGGDIYLLRSTLCDFPDEQAVAVLKACASAMTASSVALVIEALLPESRPAVERIDTDLKSLLTTGGRNRNRSTLERMFASAGLVIVSCLPLGNEYDSLYVMELVQRAS
jgi:hypothetical protein